MLTRIIAAISLTMDCVPWGGCIGCLWLAADICAMVGVFVVLDHGYGRCWMMMCTIPKKNYLYLCIQRYHFLYLT